MTRHVTNLAAKSSMPAKVALAILLSGFFCVSAVSAGTVRTDGSLGTAATLTGPGYSIDSNLGQIRGTTLFHSFSRFDLSQGDTATFNGATSITNILSRITGGTPSSIDGAIGTSITGASIYLLNPAGIVFGPNASLNVTGSFHATTADYLKLGASGRFEANVTGATNLTSDPPGAFGFLNANPASIAVNGSLLTVPQGKSISLVSGGISLVNGNLWANGGAVNLVSVASTGEVLYDGVSVTPQSFSMLGPVSITENRATTLQPVYNIPGDMQGLRTANIDASGTGGGRISIRGGSFFLSGGTIYNDTYGSVVPGAVNIAISGAVSIEKSAITGNAMTGTAPGAAITISAGTLNVSGSSINTDSQSGANGSDISLTASDRLVVSGSSTVSTDANSAGSHAGNVTVTAPAISILNGSRVSSSSPVLGATGAGSITVNAAQSLYLTGELRSDTFDGTSGAITIATGNLNITDNGLISTALVSNPAATPRSAGDISISAQNITLSNSASIQSNVLFSNSGNGGNITITSKNMNLINNSSISTSNDSVSGSGGNILVNNDWIMSLLNSDISTSATKISGSGNGGNVTINSGYLALNSGKITAQASFGSGGNLLLRLSNMFIRSTGSLLSASSRYGTDGTVVVKAPNIDVAGALAAPSFDILNLNAFLPKRCINADERNASTFRLLGGEGLPALPENSFPISLPR